MLYKNLFVYRLLNKQMSYVNNYLILLIAIVDNKKAIKMMAYKNYNVNVWLKITVKLWNNLFKTRSKYL